MNNKLCGRCGRWKSLEEFGSSYYCKVCESARIAAYQRQQVRAKRHPVGSVHTWTHDKPVGVPEITLTGIVTGHEGSGLLVRCAGEVHWVEV